jgi:peptide/nickel transport system permease protein
MGTLLITALNNGDTQIILPWMLVTGALIIAFNLFADVLYGVLNPRVRIA